MQHSANASYLWVWQSLFCALCWGVGNTTYGMNVSQIVFWGASFTAPAALLLLMTIRLTQMCLAWRRNEKWLSIAKSNYWRLSKLESLNDEFQTKAKEANYHFDWSTFTLVVLTQGVPPFIGLILVGETYRLAVLAGINQGVITVMFGSTTFLTAIVFYLYLNEVISIS